MGFLKIACPAFIGLFYLVRFVNSVREHVIREEIRRREAELLDQETLALQKYFQITLFLEEIEYPSDFDTLEKLLEALSDLDQLLAPGFRTPMPTLVDKAIEAMNSC